MPKLKEYIEAIGLLVLLVASFVTLKTESAQNLENIKRLETRFTDERKELNINVQNSLDEIRMIQQNINLLLSKDTAAEQYVSKELFTVELKNIDNRMERIDSSLQKIVDYIKEAK